MPQERWNGERGDVMSRRMLMKTIGVAAGAAVADAARRDRAGARERAGGAAEHGHQPAARLRSRRRADHLLHRPRRPHRRAGVQRTAAAQCADPAAVDGRALVGGAGLERPGALSRLERHPQQPPAALAGGRRPRQRLPQPRRTTATATRSTSRAASSPASTSPAAWSATSWTARSPSSPTAYNGKRLNSPNDVVPHPDGSYWFTDPPYGGQLYEGTPDAPGGPSNRAGRINPRLGQPPELGRAQARAADQRVSRRPERPRGPRRRRGPGARSERPRVLAGLQEALRRQHRPRARATRGRAARARCTSSTWAPTTRSPTGSSSPTSWSTASSAGRTACAATSTAISGARAMPAATWATAA